MSYSTVDEDEIASHYSAFFNANKPDTWMIFVEGMYVSQGSGFDSFRETLIHISDGKFEYDPETGLQDGKKNFAHGVYNYSPDGKRMAKPIGIAYSDDSKLATMQKFRTPGFSTVLKEPLKIKGKKFLQWNCEGDLIVENMDEEFWNKDRL